MSSNRFPCLNFVRLTFRTEKLCDIVTHPETLTELGVLYFFVKYTKNPSFWEVSLSQYCLGAVTPLVVLGDIR